MPAILELSGGWNPLVGESVVRAANFYPHGLWLLQQTTGDLFGSFEVTKIVHALLAVIALSSLLSWLAVETGRALGILPIALIYLIVLNPVVSAQALTFYVDGPVYLLSMIFLAELFLAYRTNHRRHDFAAVAAGVLLIGTKLSGLYYAGLIAFLFCAFVVRRWPGLRRWTASTTSVALIGVFVVGFHPFVIQT